MGLGGVEGSQGCTPNEEDLRADLNLQAITSMVPPVPTPLNANAVTIT